MTKSSQTDAILLGRIGFSNPQETKWIFRSTLSDKKYIHSHIHYIHEDIIKKVIVGQFIMLPDILLN